MVDKDIVNYLKDQRNIYYGRVLDNEDPLMLGRIRIHPDHENLKALLKSNDEFDENSSNLSIGKWSTKDPLIFLPLLPYYVNQIPQVGERVLIIYYDNSLQNISDRFYLVGPFSSPTRVGFEDYNSSNTHLVSGGRNSRSRFPNIKNLDGTYKNINNSGVFAEPTDIALKGRGTSDLILKNNDVILHAGKHKPFKGSEIPEFNDGRAFLQLSKFDTKTIVNEGKKFFNLESQDRQLNFLIEYDVYNPESAPQIFTGSFTIYKLMTKNQQETKVSSFNFDTEITGITLSKAKLINIENPLSLEDFSNYVKEQIIDFVRTGGGVVDDTTKLQFPFYYRPSKRIRTILKTAPTLSSENLIPFVNMQKLVSSLMVTTTDVTPGHGLVLNAKFTPFIPFLPKIGQKKEFNTIKEENTVGVLGANRLFLLSNEKTIPGKNKIVFTDTAPKFEQKKIDLEVTPNTSSMVRGEELLELLESIVGFLVSHVHPYPLLPPSTVSYDGTSVDDLLKKMLDAYQKVLNSNIRIN